MDEFQLYRLIRQIADMAYDYASPSIKGEPWLEDRRDESVNPFYCQTESGVFLELYYGIPGNLWTPWGQWNCWGSGSGEWESYMSTFLQRLGAVEHMPLRREPIGEIGPIYALTSVDGLSLPRAVARNPNNYLPYEDAKAAWERLTHHS